MGKQIVNSAEALALVALTGLVAFFFSVWPATSAVFPTTANFQAVSGSQAVLLVATLAVLIPLVCGEFDLSVGAAIGLSSIFCASAMASGAPLAAACVIGIGTGTVIGLVNGLLVTRTRVSAVIITLGTASLIQAVVLAKTGGVSISSGISTTLTTFGSGNTLSVPRIVIVVAVLAVLVHYVLVYTPLGRHMYMLGSNRAAARFAGLSESRLLVSSFVLAGALAGIAGVLQVARSASADVNSGPTFTLPALAAAFLSAAAIRPGRFNVGGAVVAITFLAVLNAGLNLAGAAPWVSYGVNGVALVAGVSLAAWVGRRRAARA